MKFEIKIDKPIENSDIGTKITFVRSDDNGSDKRELNVIYNGEGITILDPKYHSLEVRPVDYGEIYIPFHD
jgi:hypothetical protein